MESAIFTALDRESLGNFSFRRFALAMAAFVALPPILLAAFVIVVDPYYLFRSPSWPGINTVRPFYELHVLAVKPYQVRWIKPDAVALGSSRVEVGVDPRHDGWSNANVFNFALPSNNSYAVMLTFLHAQKVSAPLKQAVVGLDFFAYNVNFPLAADLDERRFVEGIYSEFAKFLKESLANRRKQPRAAYKVHGC